MRSTGTEYLRKILIFFVLVVFFPVSKAGAGWQLIATFPQFVGASFFFNDLQGFVTTDGDDGDTTRGFPGTSPMVWRTYNGGVTWLSSSVPAGYGLAWMSDIFMTDSLNGWLSFERSPNGHCVWHTTDGGVTWVEPLSECDGATSIYETSQGVFFTQRYSLVGMWASRDQGNSFYPAMSNQLNDINFVDAIHGVATPFIGKTLFTSDGGNIWDSTFQQTEAWAVYADKGTSNFVIAGEQRQSSPSAVTNVVRSTDYGRTWTGVGSLPIRNTGHIAGKGNTIYVQTDLTFNSGLGLWRTTDGGYSWKHVGGPPNSRDTRFSVEGCNGNIVYASDAYGNLYKTTDGGDGLLSSTAKNPTLSDSAFAFKADKCSIISDSVRLSNNTCQLLTVRSIDFSNPGDETVTSGALSFTNLPALPLDLDPGKSTSFGVLWQPVKSAQPSPAANISIIINSTANGGLIKFDTMVFVNASSTGNGKPFAHFDSTRYTMPATNICSIRDTVVKIANPGCDSIFITQGTFDVPGLWTLLTADGLDKPIVFPIAIPPGTTISLKLRFQPQLTGIDRRNLTFRLSQRGITSDTTIAFTSFTVRVAPIIAEEQFDFGDVSVCKTSDTVVTYKNAGCEDLVINSIGITPAGSFSILDNFSYPFVLPHDSTLLVHIRYTPKKNLFENAIATLNFTATGDILKTDVLFIGRGLPGSSALVSSAPVANLKFPPRNVCQGGDSISFTLRNPGCDSLQIMQATFTDDGSLVYSYSLSSTIPDAILASDLLKVTVYADPVTSGNHIAQLKIRYKLADGTIVDTIYTFTIDISPGPKLLASDPPLIGFDTIALCKERDSMIVLTNIGCADVTISDLSIDDPAYNFLRSKTLPYTIKRFATDTIWLRYSTSTPGKFTGTLNIKTDADSLPTRDISLIGVTQDKDYLQLYLDSVSGAVYAGDTAKIAVLPDRDWIGKGITRLGFKMRYNSDLLSLTRAHHAPDIQIDTVYTQETPDGALLAIDITSQTDITLTKDVPLLVLDFYDRMTDTLSTMVTLSDIAINNFDKYYSDCILGVSEKSMEYSMLLHCGEGPLSRYMRNLPILFIANPTPNPLTEANGYRLHLPVDLREDAVLEVSVSATNGEIVYTKMFDGLSSGKQDLILDLAKLSGGSYSYSVRAGQANNATVSGKFVIVK
jgi:photosystem II stability/assembly factor-like uncharacterized protein